MYLHTIELRLAAAKPKYGEYARKDSLVVMNDCNQNMLYNGKLRADEIPEVVALGASFHEFYEGALGAYSTHSVFGSDTFAGIGQVGKIAKFIGWTDLSRLLKTTLDALNDYPQTVIEEFISLSAPEKINEQLGALLVDNFGDLVEQDSASGYKMRRLAQDWVQNQLERSRGDDSKAVPILPATIEEARNRLGLELPMLSLVEWRQTLSHWQDNRQKANS